MSPLPPLDTGLQAGLMKLAGHILSSASLRYFLDHFPLPFSRKPLSRPSDSICLDSAYIFSPPSLAWRVPHLSRGMLLALFSQWYTPIGGCRRSPLEIIFLLLMVFFSPCSQFSLACLQAWRYEAFFASLEHLSADIFIFYRIPLGLADLAVIGRRILVFLPHL